MRIGFIGNANNYPFMLARAFRRMGHDVLFIITHDRRTPLDRPENKYKDLSTYPEWIYDVSPLELWNHADRDEQKERDVVSLLKTCDLVVLNQYAICLAPEINRPSVALLTGTDLLTLARPEHVDERLKSSGLNPSSPEYERARRFYEERVSAQRLGISQAVVVVFFPEGAFPRADKLLNELGVNNRQRTFFLMTDTHDIAFSPPPSNRIIRTFCATRLTWDRSKPPFYTDLDYKGSDIMIRGLGLFYRTHKTPLDIHLVRKGAHVPETMELVRQEGLEPLVTWHDEMSQIEVLEQMKKADIIFEQLGDSMFGMAGLDAMAVGRPVIANGRSEIMEKVMPSPPPICNAKTPEDVCSQLKRLVFNPEERERIGKASREYVEKYFSSDLAAEILINKIDSYVISSIVSQICETFKPGSVINIGYNSEEWLKEFELRGVTVAGFSKDNPNSKLERHYDLCLCLDPPEALTNEQVDSLISSCSNSSNTIIFATSLPNTFSNERPISVLVEKFYNHGFVFIDNLTPYFHKLLCLSEKTAKLNIHVLKRMFSDRDLETLATAFPQIPDILKNKERCIEDLFRYLFHEKRTVVLQMQSPSRRDLEESDKKLSSAVENMPAIDFVLPREYIFHEEGYCYIYPFRTMAAKMFSYLPVYNHLILYEDGNPLPLGNALHEEIRRAGKGRYSMWYEQIYFSTSDNSDPRTNGRTYSVRVPSYIYVLENLPEEQIRGVNL